MNKSDIGTILEPEINKGFSSEDIFFSLMALLILTTVFIGFARTYFLAGIFTAPLPAPIIHIHAVVFTTWILLLITQITLVSTNNVDIHRKLGIAGFVLALLVVVIGILAATNSLSRGFQPHGLPIDSKTFYIVPLSDILIFGTLIFFAYRARFKPANHKRLILIATIALMGAPTGRPPFAALTHHPHMDGVICWIFLLLVIGYDLWSTRKIKKVTIFAALLIIIVEQIRLPIGGTNAWHSFVAWVLSLPHM
jgi:FtsH-binding integral membrane protein